MSRRYSYGDTTSGISSRSSNIGSRYDSSPSRSYSSNYDSGLRSYSSNRTLSELNNYGTSSSLSRYGSSSGVYESSRPPRPSSASLDRYSSSINVGSGVGSGSYRSSLEYSAPTRSYSYASGLSGSSYSSPYSAGSSTYRTGSSYSGYSSGLSSSSRDYGSSKGLSKRDDYGSYSSSRGLYGSLSEAHSDITLKSTYTPRRYGTYESSKESKSAYSGVLKSERELEKSTTPEIEQAFMSKPPEAANRKLSSSTLQLPDTTTNDEFNAFYDRYVTHSPVLAMEKEDEQTIVDNRRKSDSVVGDSAYSSKTGQESEILSTSDRNEEIEALEQDEETEQEESDTICCATNSDDKEVAKSDKEIETKSPEKEVTTDKPTQDEEEAEEGEIEFSAESADESNDVKNQKEELSNDMEKSSHGLWDDFNSTVDDQAVTDGNEQPNNDNDNDQTEVDGVKLVVYKRSPWEDFNSSFAEDEAEQENEENDNEKSSGIPATGTPKRNPWDDFASSFADEDGEEEEEWESHAIQRNIAKQKLQLSHEIAASNSSLWSDFDVPYDEPNAEYENEANEEETAEQEIEVQRLTAETYKPAVWEQFCSFDGGTDNEAEDDDENEANAQPWKQFCTKPSGRKYSIQIEAETDSESEDISDHSPKSHSHHKQKKSSTMLLAPPGKSVFTADTSGASDVESEFEFTTNSVSATFPFLPSEPKQDERGRVEAHLALPAPVFNIHMSYDSDYPDEESVASVSDYEDLSDGSDDDEEEDEVEVDVDDEEYEDEIKQDNVIDVQRKNSKIVPHIMVTSSDVSEMMTASDYQERLSQDSPNDAAYDADISRPASMYSSGDNFMFKSAEDDSCLKLVLDNSKKKETDDDADTTTTFITIKRTPKVDFKELSPNRSITPDSENVDSQRSDGEFEQSVYHDAPDMKPAKHKARKTEQESEVFVDDYSDDEYDAISHKSDLFVDAPTTADIFESKEEVAESAADINECHPKQYDMAIEVAPEEEVTLVAKKFQQSYKEAKDIEKQKLLRAKVETETSPAEKAGHLISSVKKPDISSALVRTVKGVSDNAKVQQTATYVAPLNSTVTTIEANELPKVTSVEAIPKSHTVSEKVSDVKVTPTLAKTQTEKVNFDRAESYQIKKPQETFAKKSLQLEPKQEKIIVKSPQVQITDKEPLLVKKEAVTADQKIEPKSEKITPKQGTKTIEANLEIDSRQKTSTVKDTTPQISPVSHSDDTIKSKPKTTGINKMSEKFESKMKPVEYADFKQKYGAQKAVDEKQNKSTDTKVSSDHKYPKAFSQPEAPAGPSFEEQMEELRRKMKAGSSQISQQMKDLSKGISDVTTATKLVAEQETHKSVLTDASNLRDQVSKKVDKWKVDSEAETAKREQELKDIAEKQAQKAKTASAAKLASSSQTSISKPETKNLSISEIQRQQEKELNEIAEKKAAEPSSTKPITGLHGRAPSKLTSPFMQKEQAEIEKTKKDSLESLLTSKQASTMKPLQPLITAKLPDTKASSASPLSRTTKIAVEETKACSMSPSIPQQKTPVAKQITGLTQRLGPDGESDHEAKGPSKFAPANTAAAAKPIQTTPNQIAQSVVASKIKDDAPKQTAELTKSKLTKADIVEQGVASQVKVKGAQQQAELIPSKIHGADEAKLLGTKTQNKTVDSKLDQSKISDSTKLTLLSKSGKKPAGKCYKCKHRRNKFIGKHQDIDDLLNNKENKNKTFDQIELFYQNCGRDKRTIDAKKTKGTPSKRSGKTHIWDVTDVDELYEDKDLRALMGMLSPTSKVTFDFFVNVDTKDRKPGDGDSRRKVDECNVQIYRSYENGQADFGSYLDHDMSLADQPDELAVLKDGRRTSLVLRTQLSVRVHTIIEKLLNSTGRDLRRALFSLKQIFQDDKDLVHEFVQSDGLSCLIKVGAEADQNYQNYILRALGQVMLYVDGMNGVIAHNETIQWLYSLLSSQFRLVVKTALKLLLVFVEYTESNSLLLLAAVYIVDKERDASPWSYLMYILNDKDNADLELLVYAMTLINKSLNGIPDQDTYYDVVDALEEQGMEEALKKMFKLNHKELTEQCRLYEGMLNQEDGDGDETGSPAMNIAKMRQTPRTRTGSGDRKSHRKQYGSDEKRKVDSSNGPVSPEGTHKSKPRFEQIAPKQEPVKYGREKAEELNNNVSSKPSYLKRNQDTHATPGLTANKRLTMDLLYKKGTMDRDDQANETTVAEESPSKQEEQNKTKCPPPKLPDLSYDDGDTPTSPPPFQKQPPAVGAVHSLAEKFGPNTSPQKAVQPAEPEPQPDDDDNSQNNVFAAALSKARKGMDKKIATQQPVDCRKESDIQWEKAMESLNRPLIINDLDFTELEEMDDSDPLRPQPIKIANGRPYGGGDGPVGVPPPPPFGVGVPPPPPFGGVPPPPPGSAGPPKPPGSPLLTRQDTDQSKDMRTVKLFWKEAQLQQPQSVMETRGVFWQKMKPVEIDSEKLVHLFETKTTKEVVAKKKEDKKPEVCVLDTKRSNAINIGLKKLPPPRAIKTAIMKYDSAIMNKEGIEKILSTMMPTEEEKEKIAEAQAMNPDVPLGNAEQFLLLLSEIPALLPRLRLWLFMLDYANLEKEVAEPLMDLKLAMEELDQSRTFQYVMATLLAVGNVLNGAEIKGFQLDFLAKVPEVKDTVNKHSLVHHLCTMVQEKFPDSTDLYSELGAVVRCSKVDFDEVMSDLERMEKECKASWDYLRVLAKHESSHNLKTKISEFLSDCAQRIMTLKIIHRRVINRFRKFLLYMGIPQHSVKDTKINSTCKTIAEFALDYRTCCDKINQQKKRLLDKRERNKTRGKMITDNVRDIAQNGSPIKSPSGRREEARHDELSKVLQQTNQDEDGANSWKNYPGARLRQRPRNISPNPQSTTSGGAAADGQESPDDEILDGLVKAATVKTDHPREQRRKARQFNRKSLRRTRTLKLVQDQVGD